MMICAALVFFMTPGLAFFYGGLVRRKNVCNTIMACVAIMGLSVVMWTLFGYSLSFGGNHAGIIGDFRWFGLNGVGMEAGPYADSIPHLVFCAFQMMFAMITPALITGSLVGRMKFKALFLFVAIWSVIVYYPMAHMVWGDGGFLAAIGSVDFAGGDVVHISSGISALVLAIILGRRRGYEHTTYRIHNIPSVVLGASLLWFGWFGFNAGSALGANGLAANAFITTNTAAAMAMIAWILLDIWKTGKPTILGAITGAVAGLVAITAGCDVTDCLGAIIIGAVSGVALAGVVGWFILAPQYSDSGNVVIPVIRRPQTAVKVQPSEPGGMEILNQDKSVYDIREKKDKEPVVENLLPPPEQPKLPEVIPSQQVVQAAPLQVNDQIPEKVIGTAPVAQVKEAAPLPVSANAQTGDAPEAKVIGLKEAVQQENAKAAQAAQIPTQPKVQPAVQPEPKKPAAPAKATAGMWQIQLMSSPNRQAVEKAWISLSKKYKMLQGQPHEIEAADLDFDKTFYRLKAGAFTDRAGADELCKDIKALGGTCIVKKK